MTRWRYAAATATGLVRETNQDAIFADDALAIVADGMGGHAAGEVASLMTVDAVYHGFLERPTVEGVVAAIDAANREVLANAKANPERHGMGTTVIAVGLVDDPNGQTVPVLFHVGDSRAYQLRDGALRQLSDDHSVAEEWVRMGRLTPEEALVHPRRHQLTRAIGVDQPLEIDVKTLSVQAGDRLLLCSDGLSNELSPDAIAELAGATQDLTSVVETLVQAATLAGGRDNISAVLVEFVEVHESSRVIDQVIVPAPPTPPRAEPSTTPTARRTKRRLFTWRNGVVVVVVAGLVWSFFAIMHWYAYANFYLANDAGRVVIYQGQPSGVLWYKPELVHVTRFKMKELRAADRAAITATVTEPSLRASLQYITYLHAQWQLSLPTTTTTVTTSTTVATTSTTTTTKAKK